MILQLLWKQLECLINFYTPWTTLVESCIAD